MDRDDRARCPRINTGILYCPPWSFDDPQALMERTRSIQYGLNWLAETKVIAKRISPSQIPFNCRFAVADLSRLGNPAEALAFIQVLLERGGELVTPSFRLVRSESQFEHLLSVFRFFADLRKAYKSACIRDGLTISRKRGVQPSRRVISPEQQAEIRRSYEELKSYSAVAKRHSVSRTSVFRAVRGKRHD